MKWRRFPRVHRRGICSHRCRRPRHRTGLLRPCAPADDGDLLLAEQKARLLRAEAAGNRSVLLLLLQTHEKSLEFEKPKYDEIRSLLRSGPASSLRINIRAVQWDEPSSILSLVYKFIELLCSEGD